MKLLITLIFALSISLHAQERDIILVALYSDLTADSLMVLDSLAGEIYPDCERLAGVRFSGFVFTVALVRTSTDRKVLDLFERQFRQTFQGAIISTKIWRVEGFRYYQEEE